MRLPSLATTIATAATAATATSLAPTISPAIRDAISKADSIHSNELPPMTLATSSIPTSPSIARSYTQRSLSNVGLQPPDPTSGSFGKAGSRESFIVIKRTSLTTSGDPASTSKSTLDETSVADLKPDGSQRDQVDIPLNKGTSDELRSGPTSNPESPSLVYRLHASSGAVRMVQGAVLVALALAYRRGMLRDDSRSRSNPGLPLHHQ